MGRTASGGRRPCLPQDHDVQFRDNLALLAADKKPKDEIFHDITSRHVNKYFSGIVKGLTAKVFRTYLASTVVNELPQGAHQGKIKPGL